MIGFNNGLFQSVSEINIPITSISINRGYGAFEFFEVINGMPFYGARHFARFNHSLHILKLKTEYQSQLFTIVDEIVVRNNLKNTYIKVFVLPHEGIKNGFYKASLYVFPVEMPTFSNLLYTEGAALTTRNFQRFLPEAKSTNYLAGQFWMDEISDKKVVDVLYHNGKTIQETSRGNFFLVKDNMVITPDVNILKGITRSIVLDILPQTGLSFSKTKVPIHLLDEADEVFITSTTKQIMPVTRIDRISIGNGQPGPITQQLMAAFKKIRAEFIKV